MVGLPGVWEAGDDPVALSTLLEGYQWTLTAVAGIALALIGLTIALRAKASQS
jgi:hypothetical protein